MIETFADSMAVYLQSSLGMALIAAYLAGVLISFTSCTYPVLPMTIAYIGAHGSSSRAWAFLLSLVYVLGMSVTYSLLGLLAALTGSMFGLVQTNFWTLFVVANLCLLMGLSMLGVFVLPVRTPAFVMKVGAGKKGGIAGGFLVGAMAGMVMGPCTAPVLAVLLGYVASRQSPVFGAALLFIFSFGMGTLLLLAGTFAGLLARLPRSGEWMERINKLCGWILLGMGEYFLIQAGSMWI